ncbi:MAG: asparagine synthase (glutamine-hydrolyzing) [Acutalibacteraceae bacterium]|nr:asparagine synthase (glutamine-hydrolyzing) [Acutalibacteraceae bacterium]
MCGFCTWFSDCESISDKREILLKMQSTLCLRGPDEYGEYFSEKAALLHRRLTVIDPQNGKQPMLENISGKDVCLVYNGELYNTSELRDELSKAGYTFNGHSDTEVLLKCYLLWGDECVCKLNGIFAFAVYDSREEKLFIARDPIGVKPFFYYLYDGGILTASEIKALLANPIVKPQIDETGLMELLFIGPGRTGGGGVFKGVEELLPGECAVYKNGRLNKTKYFKLKAKPHPHNIQQTVEYTKYLLTDAIERQLASDVPLCTFLSGGLDSSIISCTAAQYYKRQGKKLDTYSVNYTDNKKYFQKSLFQPNSDEEFIDLMVRSIGSQHNEVVIDNTDLYNALFDSVKARDLPGMVDVDSSLLLFCREVKKRFTVALSGECADELFGGYPWYHNKDILFEDCFPWSRSQQIRRSILKKGVLSRGEEYVREKYLQTVNSTDVLPTDSPLEKRMKEMFMLNFNWFMQTLLDRKDRCSMYASLEVRVPFCDYRIVEYAYNMPWEIKALNGREKGIVRTAFADSLPREIIKRKKSPYPKTHNPIYMKLCAEGALKVLENKNSPLADLLDAEGIKSIIEYPDSISSPWYGQLMRAPQILAYIAQLDFWFREYNVEIV